MFILTLIISYIIFPLIINGQGVTHMTYSKCGVKFDDFTTTYDIEPLQAIVQSRNDGIITMTGGDLGKTLF